MIIAAYCRVSTGKDEQLASLANQKAFFIAYAKRNGHVLYQLYADEGISGTSLKRRDAFNRLMHDARCGFFQTVVVKDISRLARNTVDFLVSIRELKAMGINVVFLNANMDSMGDSEFILTLFSAMAQEESGNLSRRTKFGKRLNAEKGRVPQQLYGYDRIDNFTLAINPEEARVVRKIFSLYNDQGLGCRTISLTLNRDGDRTKHGNEWNPRGVRRVLVNPIYKGTLVNHKYEVTDFLTGKQVQIPAEDQFQHPRPEWAIVSPEVFRKTQQIMASRRNKCNSGEPFPNSRYSGRHIFSTLIKCAHCGRSFTRKSYTYVNTRVYWRCSTNDQYTAERCDNNVVLNESDLILELKKYFASVIADKEAFISHILAGLEQSMSLTGNPAKIKEELESQRKRLLFKKDRYREMYANALITLPELKARLSAIAGELKSLDTDLAKAKEISCSVSHNGQWKYRYTEEILRFLELDSVTNTDMRRILDHISVNRDGNVQIRLKFFGDAESF